MPARYQRIDAHIAHLIWEDKVSYEELEAQGKEGRAYFASLNEMPIVLLIEVHGNTFLPVDITSVRNLLRKDEAATIGMVLVGTRPVIQLGGKLLINVFRRNVAFANTLEEGLEKARAMRDDYLSKQRKDDHDE